MRFIKTSERLPKTGDFYYVKVDTKRDNIVSVICEFGGGEWNIEDISHHRDDIYQDSEVLCWLDENEMQDCNGNCGMNYCDENGCIDRKKNLVNSDNLIPNLS